MKKLNISNFKAKSAGFTLIELMIVIVVISLLAAIAYPSYVEYVRRGRRVEAQGKLQQAAQWMQRYYSTKDKYDGATLPNPLTRSPDNGAIEYNIVLATNANPPTYLLTATPVGDQLNDKCGTLTLNWQGVKTVSQGNLADCWK